MLREDGTSYLNVLEVKTSIKLGGQEITATPTVTATDISFDPTGREFAPESTDVDLALVEAINRVKSLEDAGGGSSIVEFETVHVNYSDGTYPSTDTGFGVGTSDAAITLNYLTIDGTTYPEGNYEVEGIAQLNVSTADMFTISIFVNGSLASEGTLPKYYPSKSRETLSAGRHTIRVNKTIEGLVTNDTIKIFLKAENAGRGTITSGILKARKTSKTVNKTNEGQDI